MMKIGFDSERLKNPQNGLGKFCEYLGSALLKQERFSYQFFQKKKTAHFYPATAEYGLLNDFHKVVGVPAKVDLWHCTHQSASYLPMNKFIPIVTTIHDLNFLHGDKSAFKVKRSLAKVQGLIDRSSAVAFISQFTANEVSDHLDLSQVHSEVIYNGPALLNTAEILENDRINPFFFTIGLISEKKNFHTLIPLLTHFTEHELVISGNTSNDYSQKILNEAHKYGVANRVILTGEITEAQKISYYQHCEAFLMPSLAEGFCLPVIEAMHFGKPVFLSSIGALKEIGSNKAYYWTNFDTEQMLNLLQLGLADFKANKTNKETSVKLHASLFSWEKAANAYANLYEKVLSK